MIYYSFKPFGRVWVILLHIFCNPMHALLRIILLSCIVFMYVCVLVCINIVKLIFK